MSSPTRVVYDCNVLLQALASPNGPSGRCFKLAMAGSVVLFISPFVLQELSVVTSRPKVIKKLALEADRVDEFLETVSIFSTSLDNIAEPFTYARDPKDAHYINLALAAAARLVVSRDKDLLDLMNGSTPEGKELLRQYPDFSVLSPTDFLRSAGSIKLGQEE